MKARTRNRFSRLAAGVTAGMSTLLVTATAFAQSADASGFNERDKWVALAAGLGLGIAAFGGALGQGRAAAAALDGIARNPGAAGPIRGSMILGLALIESLVIYALIIGFILVGKIG